VEYIDIDNDALEIIGNTRMPFFRKRKDKGYEQEIRAIIQIIDPKDWISYDKGTGIPVSVSLDELIENVYVFSDALKDFHNLVQANLNECGLKIAVKSAFSGKDFLNSEEKDRLQIAVKSCRGEVLRKSTMEEISIRIIPNSGNDVSGNITGINPVVSIIGQNPYKSNIIQLYYISGLFS
jgi:hypothetical protein